VAKGAQNDGQPRETMTSPLPGHRLDRFRQRTMGFGLINEQLTTHVLERRTEEFLFKNLG
jgi:hypothetical protein